QRFAIITRVLDGQGLMTDSGTHGRRGYRGDYLFAWIGCTTPFEESVGRVLAQLGSRLFFFVMDDGEDVTVEELVESEQGPSYAERLTASKQALHPFLTALFEAYGGVRGVKWDSTKDPRHVRESIARCATLLSAMRSEPAREGDPERNPGFTPAKKELPRRAFAILRNIARAHALVFGRTSLSEGDLPVVARVTISSMPTDSRLAFAAFVESGEPVLTRDVRHRLGVKHPATASKVLADLEGRGIVVNQPQGPGNPTLWTLHEKWRWCASPEFRALLLGEPIKNQGV